MTSRRQFLERTSAAGLAAHLRGDPVGAPQSFEIEEWTIAQLQAAMRSGRLTSQAITELYLDRIAAVDQRGPTLRHVIETNPDASQIAARLDAERRSGRVRGPLHGVPVIVKDNIDTADRMHTSAGSLALAQSIATRDSGVAERLRAAGAVILAKSNLSEWANIRSSRSSSGWSARGGQGKNPYALDRTPCGSSSGTGGAIAASYAAVGVGTETDGSIVCPSAANSLVGIKPTVGLISRSGIIPIAHSQDTAGPMARTVRDAAIMLGALTGEDPRDPATGQSRGQARTDYTSVLDADGLRGARIGVARAHVTGYSEHTDALYEDALRALAGAGAEVVDGADIPHMGDYDGTELSVLLYELKADLNEYLASLGPQAPVKSLAQLIAFNEANRAVEMPWFGQDLFVTAEAKGPLTEREYRDALAMNHALSRAQGIDAVMDRLRLDALVAPTAGPPWPVDLLNGDHSTGGSSTPAAVAGYPTITVPMGYVNELPVGLTFIGRAWTEPILIKLAYAYEQATQRRHVPRYLPTAPFPGYTV
ncbi:MAG: amidase [Gemmatimonadetes bacterium]|nr:amidase [Gemmatimonadota bacterium]